MHSVHALTLPTIVKFNGMHTHTHTHILTHTTVARRCIPTFIDLEEQFEEVFNFNTSEDIQNVASSGGFGDLVLNLTVQDLVDGTL